MNNTKPCDRLIDYYNGHLNEEEKQAFEDHLTGCPDCQKELAEWDAMHAELVHGFEQVEPPADMEKRILTSIFNEDAPSDENRTTKSETRTDNKDHQQDKSSRRPNGFYKKLMIPLAAALLLSVIGNIYLWNTQQESQTISQALLGDEQTVDLAPVSETLDMDAKMALHENNGSRTLVLEAHNFTNLDEGEVYQVWLMNDEKPYRAGTMVPNENGEGYIVFTLDESEDINWDQIAITIEPSPHNEVPQGDIVMSGDF